MGNINRWIQNLLVAFIMSCSVTAIFRSTSYSFMNIEIFYIPIVFLILFLMTIGIAEDVRNSFKKVLKFEKRKDPRPIWQVGVGMIFFFSQVGAVEVFARNLMTYDLGGMPLYLVFSFMNAFLITVIYEELVLNRIENNKQINLGNK